MRGQRHLACVHDWALRIIPARAGPTTRAVGSLSTRTDHPRSCGANDGVVEVAHLFSGSSPLVRGQPDYIEHCGGWLRIIPARAGPTYSPLKFAMDGPDHPRSCGANASKAGKPMVIFGSSPLVRGQRHRVGRLRPPARIIPARAGPTRQAQGRDPQCADHPRSCGANFFGTTRAIYNDGSSPLVRGQPQATSQRRSATRIIPARAGPTQEFRVSRPVRPDHPRSCGANANAATPSTCRSGSSPLVRGQRQTHPRVHDRERIIPARAGPTSFPFLWWSGGSDHPRSCGANSFTLAFNWPITGSSPLVRGQRRFPEPFDAPHRIIPARGGANVSR